VTTKVYKTVEALLRAIHAGEVPVDAVSPGGAASRLGISRQRVFQLIDAGQLDCWRVRESGSGFILVGVDSVKARLHAVPGDQRKVG
jgi:hypothetical protein